MQVQLLVAPFVAKKVAGKELFLYSETRASINGTWEMEFCMC